MLLRTKLFVPPAPPTLIPRPRLISRLHPSEGRKILVIAAPAGSGKTTLVAAWLPSTRKCPPLRQHFCPHRHRLKAVAYRQERMQRFQIWNEVVGVPVAA